MACTITIMLYFWAQMKFDNFHPNSDRLYRVYIESEMVGFESDIALTPSMFSFGLKKHVREIEQSCRIRKSNSEMKLETASNQIIDTKKVLLVDSTFFEIFGFKLLEGDKLTCLNNKQSIIISKSIARRYFPNGAIGEKIKVENSYEWLITGIVEDCPANSHIRYDVIASLSSVELPEAWSSYTLYTYFRLTPDADAKRRAPEPFKHLSDIEYKLLRGFFMEASSEIEYHEKIGEAQFRELENSYRLRLQKVKNIHLFSNLDYEMSDNINIQTLLILSGISFLIILIAIINYANLSTARLASRVKEMGIRKVLGSHMKDVAFQFIAESLTISFISAFIALVILEIAFPFIDVFFNIPGNDLSYSLIKFSPVIILITIVTGVLAGMYPAWYVMRNEPAKILGQQKRFGPGSKGLRSILVLLQFLFSILIIFSTSTIYRQLNYVQSKGLGFNKENLVILDNALGLENSQEGFLQKLLAFKEVENAAFSDAVPGKLIGMNSFNIEGDTVRENYLMYLVNTDTNFIDTYGIELLVGDYSVYSSETKNFVNIVVNEAAVEYLGLEDPLNSYLSKLSTVESNIVYSIAGVVKNFNFESLHQEVQPIVLIPTVPDSLRFMSVRLNSSAGSETVSKIRDLWRETIPNVLFSEHSMSDSLTDLYYEEEVTGKVAGVFSFFAILIACMGLYSLMSLTTVYRTKEIGIRKVLGAGSRELIVMLSKETLKLVLLASVVALPLSWLLSNLWLNRFAYHVPLSITNYLLVSVAVFGVAIFTVYRQLWRTINADPAESLRYE
jgi:putative ABC transport system permease protein